MPLLQVVDQGLVDLKPPGQPSMVALVGLDVWLIKNVEKNENRIGSRMQISMINLPCGSYIQ